MYQTSNQPRTVDDFDSNAISGMAERIAEGKLAVSAAAAFARDMQADGCAKVRVIFSTKNEKCF